MERLLIGNHQISHVEVIFFPEQTAVSAYFKESIGEQHRTAGDQFEDAEFHETDMACLAGCFKKLQAIGINQLRLIGAQNGAHLLENHRFEKIVRIEPYGVLARRMPQRQIARRRQSLVEAVLEVIEI